MRIGDAQATDLAEIQAIYAHHVLHSSGTFEEVPPPLEEIAARHARIVAANFPWLVATGADGVLGYGYYGRYRDRSAYRFTVEDSIYVREDVRGQGVGKALVAELVARAGTAGFRQMVAVIGDAENIASIGVHASLGFRPAGRLRGVAYKFGRWLDSVTMQRALGDGGDGVPEA